MCLICNFIHIAHKLYGLYMSQSSRGLRLHSTKIFDDWLFALFLLIGGGNKDAPYTTMVKPCSKSPERELDQEDLDRAPIGCCIHDRN